MRLIGGIKYSVLALGLLAMSGWAHPSLAAGAAAGAAMKTQDQYFHPTKPWAANAGAGGACVLGNQFNNGFIMQFNGKGPSPDSLTINFRQDVFKAGQSYPVTLGIPGGASQGVQGQAINASTLAINMQGQSDLFSAMRAQSVMDFAVSDNDFRFYLVGFDAAAQTYEQCLNGATPEKAASNKPANDAVAMEKQEKDVISGRAKPQTAAVNEVVPQTATPPAANDKTYDKTISDTAAPNLLEGVPSPAPTPDGHKRMSEQLAEQMAKNPQIEEAGDDETPVEPSDKMATPVAVTTTTTTTKSTATQADLAKPPTFTPDAPASAPSDNKTLASANPPPIKTLSPEHPLAEEPAQDELREVPKPSIATPKAPVAANVIDLTAIDANKPVKDAAPAPVQMAMADSTPAPQDVVKQDIIKETKPAAPAIAPVTVVTPATPTTPEVKTLASPNVIVHRQVTKLNADLTKDGLDDSSGNPIRPGGERKADPEMLKKISDLEADVADLKRENMALHQDLKMNSKDKIDESASIESQNWNLEKATMAYDESERDLKRLGQQLQQERAQCAVQKQDLEAQLFDPQLTSQKQLAHLADMEQKLADAQHQIDVQRVRYEAQIKLLESRTAPQ